MALKGFSKFRSLSILVALAFGTTEKQGGVLSTLLSGGFKTYVCGIDV